MRAWVFSGGGAKGAFQVGVIKKMFTQYGRPDIIYGTSAGSVNGAAAAYIAPDELINYWMSIRGKKDILKMNLSFFAGMADGLYTLQPMRENFLEKVILDKEPLCEAQVCRVNINTSEIDFASNFELEEADFIDAVVDSSTIPIAMSPRDVYVDGGVREIIPLEKAVDDGATDIKIVMCSPWTPRPPDNWDLYDESKFLRFVKIATRTVDSVIAHEVMRNDIRSVLHKISGVNVDVYAPPWYLYDGLDFDHRKIMRAIDLGLNCDPVDLDDLFGN
jgi:predicted acylesterase/phospholipase RssA